MATRGCNVVAAAKLLLPTVIATAMVLAVATPVYAQESPEDTAAGSGDTPAVDDILPVKTSDSPSLPRKHRAADDAGPGGDEVLDLPSAGADRVEALLPTERPSRDGGDDYDASSAVTPPVPVQEMADDALVASTRQQQAEEELRKLMKLLALPIVAASKREQKVFDSIMSASVITREEIQRSGAVSLVDVMRLLPGVFVREETPGSASVCVRGFDAIPPRGERGVDRLRSGQALLMIDGRIVYLKFSNNIPFGVLPIHPDDIERVEVVRGPATAMHGPNAVTGVVNIVTRGGEIADGVHTRGRMQAGIAPTGSNGLFAVGNGRAAVSWQQSPWRVDAVAHYKYQKRHVVGYRSTRSGVIVEDPRDIRYHGIPSLLIYGRTGDRVFPRPDLAKEQRGAYVDVAFRPTPGARVDLHAGTETASFHAFVGVQVADTALVFASGRWSDASARVRARGWDARVNVFRVEVDPNVGDMGVGRELATTADVEKEIRFGNAIVRPGAQIRYLRGESSAIGGVEEWLRSSGFVRAESTVGQLAFMAAVRADYLDALGKWHVPFETGISYRLRERHLLRLVVARAYRAADMNFTSTKLVTAIATTKGRTDIPLPRSRSLELGYRAELARWLSVDVETYAAWMDSISRYLYIVSEGQRVNTPQVMDLQVRQLGITGSAQALLGNLTLKLFATVQRTDALRVERPNVEAEMAPHELGRVRGLPTVFGGATASWTPRQDLHFNVNMHYAGEQRHQYLAGFRTPVVLRAKLLVHATVGYKLASDWTVRLSYRNILDQQAREFPFADRIRSTVVLGLEWDAHL